jgi:hypothetical protein
MHRHVAVIPAKAGIQVICISEIAGFRVALAIASLPGMTVEWHCDF